MKRANMQRAGPGFLQSTYSICAERPSIGICSRRFVILLIVIAALPRVAAAADLTGIRETLREIDEIITSIRMVYLSGRDLMARYTFLEWGGKRSLLFEVDNDYASADVFDGEYGYEVRYPGPGMHIPVEVERVEKVPGPLVSSLWPLAWSGRRVAFTGRPLWEFLGESAEIIGVEQGGFGEVVVVDLGVIEDRHGRRARYVVRLAKDRDFSPVEIRSETVGSDGGSRIRLFIVESFRRVTNPALGREVWMPESMRFDFGSLTGRVELVELELNPDLSHVIFTPETSKVIRLDGRVARPEDEGAQVTAEDRLRANVREALLRLVDRQAEADPASSWIGARVWGAIVVLVLSAAGFVWRSRSP
ncbi:hypothetical protein Mal4_01270 [Maioricimonas rarisocia]|uniref:Uncharacterized protein n=1 Tax=Maioricimonas rarisocia TaxID=2528026 RepID=A0A517Z067_9PLAN|nr:hypothetical protein [Maioricimonas rarisocia]QDU35845.1 hypothetical protein Mal4_01270 [Maioricimonas rarisocia]